jgi:hypothetical protein
MRVQSVYDALPAYKEVSMLARLVTGRYRNGFEDQPYTVGAVRPSWLRRMIATLFTRKH